MAQFTVSGHEFDLEREGVERCITGQLPDPVLEHYVVVQGRRFPPKQVLACATGLDRADFTTHQARRILKRLGFVAARASAATETELETGAQGPHGGRQAEALRQYAGQWVALAGPADVLVAAETPEQVLAWLAHHERRATYGMFRVPTSTPQAEGAAPA
jgi:hypothetical protein